MPRRSDSPKELYDKCTKRSRLERPTNDDEREPQPGTSREGNPGIKRLGIDGGKEFLKAYGTCKGHDCLGCHNAGERCAATEPSDEEESLPIWREDSTSESEEDEPLPPGQYPWYDVICDTILKAGCCNDCEAGACACGVNDHCETAIRNGFESRRVYFERYREKWLKNKKKPPPIAAFGPYKNSDPQFTTPPAPRGPALALSGLVTISKCKFGFHNIGPRKRSSDCPPPTPGDAAEAIATAALHTRCQHGALTGKKPWYCGHLNLSATSGFKIEGNLNSTSASFTAMEE